jgi:hypothetical protein
MMMMMTRIPNALGGGYYGNQPLNTRPKAPSTPAAAATAPTAATAFALPSSGAMGPSASNAAVPKQALLTPEAAAPSLLPHAFEDINAVAQKAGFLPVQAKEVLRAYRLNQSLFVDVKV